MRKPQLSTLFAVVFVDLLGFSLILPLLPFYADSYGASPTVVGLLVASYAFAQLVGAPLLGRLSDRFGRRPILLASIAGTFFGFLLLAFAEPLGLALARGSGGLLQSLEPNAVILGLLFASRIIDGLTGGNISVAQAYIADITDESSRARGLGVIGAAFGLGFIIGPALGGALSIWGFATPALAAAGLSALNWVLVASFLPESLSPDQRRSLASTPRGGVGLESLRQALTRPLVGPLLNTRFFFGMGFSMFQTIFPLYAQYHLNLTVQATGYVLTYVGVLVVIVQAFGIRLLTERFSESRLILSATALMGVSLLVWAFVPNLAALLVVLAPIALAGGTQNTVLNSALSKAVPAEEVGGTLGLSASLESLTRALSPSLGGALLGNLGTWAPGVASGVLLLALVPYVRQRISVSARSARAVASGSAARSAPANGSIQDGYAKENQEHAGP